MHAHRSFAVASLALGLLLPGCSKKDSAAPPPVKVEAKAEPAKAAPPPAPKPEPLPLLDPKDPNEACAQIIVAGFKDSAAPIEGVDRDRDAARKRIDELLARVKDPVNDLREIAAAESDAKSKARGGAIGTYTRDGWPEKHAAIADLVFGLKVNEIGGPVEAPYGWTVARRCAVEKVHTRHILIRYAGAKNADEEITRSKEEAMQGATKLARRIKGGESFEDIAREYSEDGSAERGGDLGEVGRGMFVPPYEEAAFKLEVGEMSPPIETDFGFHIIKREG